MSDLVGLWVLHRVREIEPDSSSQGDTRPEQLTAFIGYLVYRCADFTMRIQGTRSARRKQYLQTRTAYWKRAIRWVESLPPGREAEIAHRCLHDIAAHPEHRHMAFVAEHETADPRRDRDQASRKKRRPPKPMGRPRVHPLPVSRNRVCATCHGMGVIPME